MGGLSLDKQTSILELLPFEDIGLHESFDKRFGSYSQYADHWLDIGRKNLEIVKDNIFDDLRVMRETESGNAP